MEAAWRRIATVRAQHELGSARALSRVDLMLTRCSRGRARLRMGEQAQLRPLQCARRAQRQVRLPGPCLVRSARSCLSCAPPCECLRAGKE